MSNQALKLEEGRCVPPVLILTVVFTEGRLGCAVWPQCWGVACSLVWEDSGSTEVLTLLLGSQCPSAQTLSVWCCWEEGVEVVRPVTRRDFHQMKQGNVGFPPQLCIFRACLTMQNVIVSPFSLTYILTLIFLQFRYDIYQKYWF